MTNERTSKRVARAASKMLTNCVVYQLKNNDPLYDAKGNQICTAGDAKAVSASCLTQTPDKPKKGK